jgi:hypothetical protein
MKPVTSQFNSAWSGTAKSALIVGRAILMDDARNGVVNAVRHVIRRIIRLSLAGAMSNTPAHVVFTCVINGIRQKAINILFVTPAGFLVTGVHRAKKGVKRQHGVEKTLAGNPPALSLTSV